MAEHREKLKLSYSFTIKEEAPKMRRVYEYYYHTS
jgi:hypothetical protein